MTDDDPGVDQAPDSFWGVLALSGSAAFVTACASAMASGFAPTAPLISIVLPSGIVGGIAFGWAIWRIRRGETGNDIWQTVKDLWNAFTKSSL